jgi:hypothetical protein
MPTGILAHAVPVPREPRRPDREQLSIAAHNLLRRGAGQLGLDVVRSDFNSPIVDARALDPTIWDRQAPLRGLELDLDAQLRLIEEQLAPFIAEFRPPSHAQADPLAFYVENRWYGPMDAHVLYAMLRHSPPARVLEIGSGYSTLVIAEALAANAAAGRPAAHEVIDPHPSPLLRSAREPHTRAESAADVEEAPFAALRAGDVLFVDTSHVVRPGGEVVRLVLEVLPILAPGVVVQFHDIYRPFEYPRVLSERFNVHWQEHHLLQGFLAYNPNFSVICANHALWRLRRERVIELFPGLREPMQPSGFWFVRSFSA